MIRSFDNYVRKVFKFGDFLENLEDQRIEPCIDIRKIVEAVIYGSILRIRAIAEIEQECRKGIFKNSTVKSSYHATLSINPLFSVFFVLL